MTDGKSDERIIGTDIVPASTRQNRILTTEPIVLGVVIPRIPTLSQLNNRPHIMRLLTSIATFS